MLMAIVMGVLVMVVGGNIRGRNEKSEESRGRVDRRWVRGVPWGGGVQVKGHTQDKQAAATSTKQSTRARALACAGYFGNPTPLPFIAS